ncbi:MAG: xylose isomerase [Oscillospiraceae bacterium]|nr:xylose isomerase [Oscillospiraceae bacterium]
MKEYFNVPKIPYEGKDSKNPLAFKHYNKDEVIMGKKMSEHLRFAMSYWHTMCAGMNDPFGSPTIDRSYGETDPMAQAKAKADAAFEFMTKLGIEYFCFHDVDIAPEGNSLAEFKANLEEITDYIKGLMDKTGIKLLWGTANNFGNPRYMHGAGTSPFADSFACAAFQIRNAIDATIKLGGKGYVFWGGREGYETLLNTDMALELDNLARLMKMSVEYARSKGYDGDFYVEPKPKEPTKHQYDFDASTVLAFLRKYDLEKDFKLNIEANHATLAGHTFEHELAVARINNAFGSIDANQGDNHMGWDPDQCPSNIYDSTKCMLEVLKAGGFTNGGLNFDSKVRRGSFEYLDIVYAYILGMDSYALGLKKAAKLIEDGRLDQMVEARYASWNSGIGADIIAGKVGLEEVAEYAMQLEDPRAQVQSGRQELMEAILNDVLFNE